MVAMLASRSPEARSFCAEGTPAGVPQHRRRRVAVQCAEPGDRLRATDGAQRPLVSQSLRAIRDSLSDAWELRFLEVPGMAPSPPPVAPHLPYSKRQRASAESILEADVQTMQRTWRRIQWWLGEWRVPLQTEYDPGAVTAYFLRRPHLLAFRMLQLLLFVSGTWLLITADTIAIRRAEADGVPSESPQISAIRRQSAERLKDALLRLGPTFVKVAQSISTRPDVVGPDTANVLAELQDRLPAFPTEDALIVIQTELGVESAFDAFSELAATPVAAASLGQVYKGATRDGWPVAVKVQRPRVLRFVARDICILRLLLRLLRRVARIHSDLGLLADELGRGLFGELDYRQEAANAEAFATAHAHMAEVVVPRIHHALTSQRVLTMDWIDGDRTSDLLAAAQLPAAHAHAPPEALGGPLWPPGTEPLVAAPWSTLGAAPLALAAEESPEDAQRRKDEARAKLLTMVGIGVECSLEQLLGTGLLHADPHPGNLLYTRDGKLAYLDFGLLCRMERQHQAAMLGAIAHLVNGEWSRLTEDLAAMDVLKPATDRNAVTMALQEAFASSLSPNSPTDTNAAPLQFGQISSSLWKMALRFRFRLPPYYTLVLRSLASLEGVAITVDPKFRVFACAYPYVVRRLLTDSSLYSQRVLRDLVLTPDGRLRWDRFASFAATSSLATREEAMNLAAPSLSEQGLDAPLWDSVPIRPLDGLPPSASLALALAPPSGPALGPIAGSAQEARPARPSRALVLLNLLLSQEAATTRRILLDSDLRYLAEAFISKEAAPARARLVTTLSEALYAPGSLGQLPPAVPGPQRAPHLGAGSVQPARPVLAASSADAGAPALGLAYTRSPSDISGSIGGGAEQEPGAMRVQARPSPLAPGGSPAPGAAQGHRGRMKRKRLWWLLRSALGRMEGGATLRLRVVLTAVLLLLGALLLALRNLLLDSFLQLRRALGAWQVTPAGGLP